MTSEQGSVEQPWRRIARTTPAVGVQLPSTVVHAVQQLAARQGAHARGATRLARCALGAGVAAILLYLVAGQLLPEAQLSGFALPKGLPAELAVALGADLRPAWTIALVRGVAFAVGAVLMLYCISRQVAGLCLFVIPALAALTNFAVDALEATSPKPRPALVAAPSGERLVTGAHDPGAQPKATIVALAERGNFDALVGSVREVADPDLQAVLLAQTALVRVKGNPRALNQPERAAVDAAARVADAGQPERWRLPDQTVYAIEMAAQGAPASKTSRDYAKRGTAAAELARSAALLSLASAAALGAGSGLRALIAVALRRRTNRIGTALRAAFKSH